MKTKTSVLLGMMLVGCGGGNAPFTVVTDVAQDAPLRHATDEEQARFAEGDALFDLVFREPDGLGPLYIRAACSSCHQAGANGPGGVQKIVMVEADGRTPSADQSALKYGHTLRPLLASGGATPITAPAGSVLVTLRVGPAVYGRGYIEAIEDKEIVRVADEQAMRADGISGRIHRVVYTSSANPGQPYHTYQPGTDGLIGRFGLKARIATVDDFTADAFQGDMGLTTPLRPNELSNPDALTDDAKSGPDVELDIVNAVADYLRLLEIPTRAAPTEEGVELFQRAQCSVCHVPSMRTRSNYPIAQLAGIDAPIYSDLLLHDMGDLLTDGQKEGAAEAREWKTAPLTGLRFFRSYLHDGRAKTIRDAILLHEGPGSEANGSIERFRSLSDSEQSVLVDFVSSL